MDIESLLVQGIRRNPDVFGEVVREAAFIKHNPTDFGCYSTFDILPEFKEVDPNTELGRKLCEALADDDCYCYIEEDDSAKEFSQEEALNAINTHECVFDHEGFLQDYKPQLFSNGDVHIAWYWDGDGSLLVASDKLQKAALNDDCKKDYNWKWVDTWK